jgi:hypothetical protein
MTGNMQPLSEDVPLDALVHRYQPGSSYALGDLQVADRRAAEFLASSRVNLQQTMRRRQLLTAMMQYAWDSAVGPVRDRLAQALEQEILNRQAQEGETDFPLEVATLVQRVREELARSFLEKKPAAESLNGQGGLQVAPNTICFPAWYADAQKYGFAVNPPLAWMCLVGAACRLWLVQERQRCISFDAYNEASGAILLVRNDSENRREVWELDSNGRDGVGQQRVLPWSEDLRRPEFK